MPYVYPGHLETVVFALKASEVRFKERDIVLLYTGTFNGIMASQSI